MTAEELKAMYMKVEAKVDPVVQWIKDTPMTTGVLIVIIVLMIVLYFI